MFFARRAAKAAVDFVVAGLGNPGRKYEGTRHNVGFEALDVLAEETGIAVKRARFDALCGDGVVDGRRVLLLKPQTFMNLSGKSIVKVVDYYKLGPQQVIVLCDDVALAPGVLRIRLSGSDGGHNGLKSIIAFLGQEFTRVRIGVGGVPHPDYDMADWVLSRPAGTAHARIKERYTDIYSAVRLLMAGDSAEAMSRYNGDK